MRARNVWTQSEAGDEMGGEAVWLADSRKIPDYFLSRDGG